MLRDAELRRFVVLGADDVGMVGLEPCAHGVHLEDLDLPIVDGAVLIIVIAAHVVDVGHVVIGENLFGELYLEGHVECVPCIVECACIGQISYALTLLYLILSVVAVNDMLALVNILIHLYGGKRTA